MGNLQKVWDPVDIADKAKAHCLELTRLTFLQDMIEEWLEIVFVGVK